MSDLSHMFRCPRCSIMGAIYLIKIAGPNIIFKQKCPSHGGRSFKYPLIQKDLFIPYIRQSIYKCFKCGQDASVDHIKKSGPWTLLNLRCPTHGSKLPTYKIWNTIYDEISNRDPTKQQVYQQPVHVQEIPKATVTPAPEPAAAPTHEMNFCPNCGTSIKGETICGACGEQID